MKEEAFQTMSLLFSIANKTSSLMETFKTYISERRKIMYNKLMKMTLISGIVWIIGVTRELDVTRAKINELKMVNDMQKGMIEDLSHTIKAQNILNECQNDVNDVFMNRIEKLEKEISK